ncbi:MAG: sialate O-acetylesterase [Balneolaceae bacterium]|nr:sialate O-acetylesterase [Balneolaceae bacterium]
MIILALLLVQTSQASSSNPLPGDEIQAEEPAPATNIQLPALFSDDMMVQRNQYIPIWGTAEPGGVVEVVIGDDHQKTVVNKNGTWKVEMNPLPAGGPYTIEVIGKQSITFENVLSGEVWVASGQSNMEMPLAGWGQINNFEQEIAAADYPDIRLLQVQNATSPTPVNELEVDGGKWQLCSPETIPEFSSTAYFFARNLHKNLDIPVGIIHSSWGGTVAEAWTSKLTLEEHFHEFDEAITGLQNSGEEGKEEKHYAPDVLEDEQKARSIDPGFKNGEPVFAEASFGDEHWQTMSLPTLWEETELGDLDGVIWFRKTVDIPQSWTGNNLLLSLGPVDDADITWFNGQRVGSMQSYNQPRTYQIPGSLVNAGANTIAIRVLDNMGGGGIYGAPAQMSLKLNEQDSLKLAGNWKYKVAIPVKSNNPNQPTALYNAMIHPLIPYAMRGVIWYQGESNAGRAYQYRDLFSRMIQDWRTNWGAGNFPFLFVQLANFMDRNEQPVESEWAELREAQLMALSEPNTGMAGTIDIGNAKDIHPKNKQDVGMRLALNARATVYGEEIAYSGPIYRHMEKIEGNKIRLSFKHVNDGLQAKGSDELKGFAVAGKDREFYWADAEIVGDNVIVSSSQVPHPVAVRYGWSANPACNLYNGAGLPASPFRTDDWPGITKENQ